MPRQDKVTDTTWNVFFFFTGKTSRRFYTSMTIYAPDALSALQGAEEKLDKLDEEMCWGQWAITGLKREER